MSSEKFNFLLRSLKAKGLVLWRYCTYGVWADTRKIWWVNVVKTLNLATKSFMNANLQAQACAMTYRTILAIVPAMALLFAIGRGFGMQTLLQDELYDIFPGQHEVIDQSIGFVDSYLSRASGGVFVGIGVVFLLWTLISLLSNLEGSFNLVWGIKRGRSFWRKITDYTSMLLILPVLMICGSGMSIFLSSTLQEIFNWEFMTPVLKFCFGLASWVFTWLFFMAAYMLIPYTKVRWTNALLAGVIAGSAFRILQWLFVTGQLYVTHYNAIYGSFAFLPLLLIWLQLTWMICLLGALICYSAQSIYKFSFATLVSHMSVDYRQRVSLAIATIITHRFIEGKEPITAEDLVTKYSMPPHLVASVTNRLVETKLFTRVVTDGESDELGFQPAIDPDKLTIRSVISKLSNLGNSKFIPEFDDNFSAINAEFDKLINAQNTSEDVKLRDVDVKLID